MEAAGELVMTELGKPACALNTVSGCHKEGKEPEPNRGTQTHRLRLEPWVPAWWGKWELGESKGRDQGLWLAIHGLHDPGRYSA